MFHFKICNLRKWGLKTRVGASTHTHTVSLCIFNRQAWELEKVKKSEMRPGSRGRRGTGGVQGTALDNSRHRRHVYTLCLEPRRKWSDCAQQKPETVLGQIGRFWPAKNEFNFPRKKKLPGKFFFAGQFFPHGECNTFSQNSANSRPIPMPDRRLRIIRCNPWFVTANC